MEGLQIANTGSVSPGDASHFRAMFTLQHYHGKTINGRNL